MNNFVKMLTKCEEDMKIHKLWLKSEEKQEGVDFITFYAMHIDMIMNTYPSNA